MADHHLDVRVEVYAERPESVLRELALKRQMDEAAARDDSPEQAAELERLRLEAMMAEADARDEYNAAEERRRQADAAHRTTCPAVRVRQHGVAARPRERRARSTRRTSASASASDSSDPPPARLTRARFRKDTKLKFPDFALEGVTAR